MAPFSSSASPFRISDNKPRSPFLLKASPTTTPASTSTSRVEAYELPPSQRGIQQTTSSLQYYSGPSPTSTKLRQRKVINFVLGVTILGIVLFLFISALVPTSWLRLYKGSGVDYPIPPTQLDKEYVARNGGNSFDVVASIYKEDLGALQDFIHNLRQLKQFRENQKLDFRVYIYTKNELFASSTTGDNDTSQPRLPTFSIPGVQIQVTPLPNVGREGHTYLHHILTHWSSLANHTLFTQAIPHKPSTVINRISTSYSPQFTGFMGLAMSFVICPIKQCKDPWGWADTFSHLPQIYSSVYGILPEDLRDIQLQFKGQFVASARRVRGLRKTVYESWKRLLEEDENSWVYRDQRLRKLWKTGRWDKRSNPAIGHTLERSWGLLMQCGIREQGVVENCGGGLSWKGRKGGWDCQCLDGDVSGIGNGNVDVADGD